MVCAKNMGAKNTMVGMRGFEPPTSRSRTERANRTALHPDRVLQQFSCWNCCQDYSLAMAFNKRSASSLVILPFSSMSNIFKRLRSAISSFSAPR